MYKAIKDNKIIAISDTDKDFFCLVKDDVKIDDTHKVSDYAEYDGEYLLLSDIPLPTNEEQSKKRAQAYRDEIDQITAHINRLRDEEQTDEINTKISQLVNERALKVDEIKVKFPYFFD